MNYGPTVCVETQDLPAQSANEFSVPPYRDAEQFFVELEESHDLDCPSAPRSLVSTVTPVYCGANYLHALAERLAEVRDSWDRANAPVQLAEAIFVDDGAIDSSAEVLRELTTKYPWIRRIELSRNFGQHPATIAGILHSSGDWVVTLDEDLQHPPEQIEFMLRTAVEAADDVVYACPIQGSHGSAFRDLASSTFKYFVGLTTGNSHVRSFSSFRMMRGGVARAAAAVSARNTYFDVALCWFTSRVRKLPLHLVDQRFRSKRESGYALSGLLRHARRLLLSSETRFARFGILLGTGTAALSIVGSAIVLFAKLFAPETIPLQGWASVMLAVLFFGGITSAIGSVLIKYVSLLLIQALGQPVFFVVDRSRDGSLAEYFAKSVSHADS